MIQTEDISKKQSFPWLKIIFGFLILAFILIIFTDKEKTLAVLREADWLFLIPAVLITILSYCLASYAYVLTCMIFNIEAPRKKLFEIGFITIAFNNLITLGGSIGYTLRLILLKDHRNKGRSIMAVSIFFSYINFLIITLFSALSLIYIIWFHVFPANLIWVLEIAFVVFILFFFLLSFIMLGKKIRKFIFLNLSSIIKKLTGWDIRENLHNLGETLSEGMNFSRKFPKILILLILVTLADWISCLFILWFCFRAFGLYLSMMVITTGFFLAVVAGLISMIPGGLGVQDLSEAGIYNMLGAPFGVAFAGSVLFRVIYYFIPFFISLIIYYFFLNRKNT